MMDKKRQNRCARRGSETMFPGRLHDLLEYVESQGREHIVSWVNNGQAFMVHKQDEFLQLLSFFFGQTKYRSFTRQLNMWHFDRENFGIYKGAWYHPFFNKHHKELCTQMSRHAPPQRREDMAPFEINDHQIRPLMTRQNSNSLEMWMPHHPSACATKGFLETFPVEQQSISANVGCGKHSEIPPEEVSLSNQFVFNDFGFERRNTSPRFDQAFSTNMVVQDDNFATTHPIQPWAIQEEAKAIQRLQEHLTSINNSLFLLESGGALEPDPMAESPTISQPPNLVTSDGWPVPVGSMQEIINDDDSMYLLGLLRE